MRKQKILGGQKTMTDRERLELEVELKRLQYAITKAETNKQEVDVKLLEKELDVARLREQTEAQDKLIQELKEKILVVQGKLKDRS
jgi:hypothetical protein